MNDVFEFIPETNKFTFQAKEDTQDKVWPRNIHLP